MRRGVVPAIVLIALGVWLLLRQLVPVLPEGVGLVFVGVVLLAVRFAKGGYGFTIAGSLCLTLGLYSLVEEIVVWLPHAPHIVYDISDVSFFFFMALGFFLIYIIERGWLRWPLIPAISLLVLGVLMLVLRYDDFERLWDTFWPVVLIVIGVGILLGALPRRRPSRVNGYHTNEYKSGATPPPRPATAAPKGPTQPAEPAKPTDPVQPTQPVPPEPSSEHEKPTEPTPPADGPQPATEEEVK